MYHANTRMDESQAGIKIVRGNINGLGYADDPTLMTESEAELKSFLMQMKEENEKTGLNINIQRMTIRASGPITSWQLDGEKMKTVVDFIFFGSKITVDGAAAMKLKDTCSLEEKQ